MLVKQTATNGTGTFMTAVSDVDGASQRSDGDAKMVLFLLLGNEDGRVVYKIEAIDANR